MGDDIISTTPSTITYYCGDELHGGRGTKAAWFVWAACRHGDGPRAFGPVDDGRAAAVCDEHLADGVRYCTEAGGISEVIVRRVNADTADVERSAL